MLTTAGALVCCGTVLEPTGAGEWAGDDGACEIRCAFRPDRGAKTWRASLHLPGRREPVVVGHGATKHAAEVAMAAEMSRLLMRANAARVAS